MTTREETNEKTNKKKGLGTSFGKMCKENVQRQKELQKFCRRLSRSSLRNVWPIHGVVVQENTMTQNARAGLLFNSLNLLSGDVLVVICLNSLL